MNRIKKIQGFLIFLLTPLIINAHMASENPLSNDNERILQARLDQNAAMAAGDVERTAKYWTDDVTLRRGLGGSTEGKEAYRSLIDATPNEHTIFYIREPELIEVSSTWPLAYEAGTWTARKGSLKGPIMISGRYSAQWIKRENNWLIRSEVFVALTGYDAGLSLQVQP